MDAEEQEEYQQLLLKHKQELEDFERHFNAQIASANPSLKKKLNQRFPKEKNALEERQHEELLPYKLSGLLTCSDTTTTTTTTTHNKSNNNHHNNSNNHSNNSNNSSSKEEQAKQKKREKNKKKADSKKKKQDEMRKQVQDEFEREGGVTMRMKELQAILNQLNPLHLTIHEIESDGHCLYRAVCHQLLLLQSTEASKMVNHVENDGQNEHSEHDGHDDEQVMIEEKTKTTTMNHLQLRRLVANYLRENKNDFIYFMETEDGDIMDDAQYENYCKTVESSSEWGGQIELRAIAFILQKPIRIFQQGQQPILMGEEFVDPSDPEQGVLSVSYHRSYYSLGEHYNSIIETPKEEEPL